MEQEGADAIDIGGESTRPGSDPVTADEEMARTIPVIARLAARLRIPISIDTSKATVARRALDSGAVIVNDVTAGSGDPLMFEVVAQAGAGLVLMHMRGTPRNMQADPRYDDVVLEVSRYLSMRVQAAAERGCERTNIVVDPGIGFGKDLRANLLLLHHLDRIVQLGQPVLVGTSRKSFIGKITGQESAVSRIEGTIASSLSAVMRGAVAVRVHDVGAVRRALDVWSAIASAPDVR